jgi:hypothetical protein
MYITPPFHTLSVGQSKNETMEGTPQPHTYPYEKWTYLWGAKNATEVRKELFPVHTYTTTYNYCTGVEIL